MSERQVKCPECGKPTLFSPENPYRPFCSKRCRLVDLGQWAEGRYAVPVGSALNNSTMPDGSVVSSALDEEDVDAEIAAMIEAEFSRSAPQSDDNE